MSIDYLETYYISFKLKYLNLKDVSIDYENDIKDDNFEKCNLDNFKINVY